MRGKANKDSSGANILLGSLNGWIGTSFWKIDHSMQGAENDTIGLFFRQFENGFQFAIDGRQLRTEDCRSQQDIAALRLVERVEVYPFEKFGMREVDRSKNVNYTVSYESEVFADVDVLMSNVEQFLSEFISSVNEVIAKLGKRFPEFNARKLTTRDTEIFERRL